MMRRAPSAASSRVDAAPRPPVPPTSSTSLPLSDSGKIRLRVVLHRYISAAGHYQKHRQHFAIAQIVFEQPGDHGGDDNGDGAVQNEAAVARTWRQAAQR